MTSYATGKRAVGQCRRCGVKTRLSRLRSDGETNLLVCASCYDEKHPAERPVRVAEGVALRRPAPDLDVEADVIPAEFDMPLAEAKGWAAGTYFGGGT